MRRFVCLRGHQLGICLTCCVYANGDSCCLFCVVVLPITTHLNSYNTTIDVHTSRFECNANGSQLGTGVRYVKLHSYFYYILCFYSLPMALDIATCRNCEQNTLCNYYEYRICTNITYKLYFPWPMPNLYNSNSNSAAVF